MCVCVDVGDLDPRSTPDRSQATQALLQIDPRSAPPTSTADGPGSTLGLRIDPGSVEAARRASRGTVGSGSSPTEQRPHLFTAGLRRLERHVLAAATWVASPQTMGSPQPMALPQTMASLQHVASPQHDRRPSTSRSPSDRLSPGVAAAYGIATVCGIMPTHENRLSWWHLHSA